MISSPISKSVASSVGSSVTKGGSGSGGASNIRSLYSRSGQSLSLGSVGGSGTPSVVSSGTISGAKMVSPGGTRPRIDDTRIAVDSENVFADRFGSLVNLAEAVFSNFGETYSSGVASRLTANNTVHTGIGRGAQTIAQLSLGSRFFTDLMIALNETKQLVEADSEVFDWKGHWWAQGEADVVGNTNYATYRAALVQYFADLKTYGNAQLDGNFSPKFVTYQVSNPYVSNGVQNWGPIDALLDVGLNETDMFCAGPWYWLEYEDTAHLESLWYRRGGEMIGKVMHAAVNGTNWKPLYWTDATRSGSTITVTYDVPVGNLVKDTSGTYVTDPGDAGFEYSGANISSVTVTSATTLDIALDASAGGTLGYARQETSNNVGPANGARGIIRDSDTATAVHDSHPLYNWACHQEEVVS